MIKFTDKQIALIISSLSIRHRIELSVFDKKKLSEVEELEKIFCNLNNDFYYSNNKED